MKQIYEFEDFRADPSEQLLLHDGQPVALTPKVFETLLILLESDGRLIDKEDFISRLWPGVFVEDVALAKNISHLRRILADGKNGTEMIQTVPKRGYRFAVPVRKVVDPPPGSFRPWGSSRSHPSENEDAKQNGLGDRSPPAGRFERRRVLALAPQAAGLHRERYGCAGRLHQYNRRSRI